MPVMVQFMQAVWKMPWFWRLWVMLLMMVNMLLPILNIASFEAQVVLAVFMLAAVTQMIIFHRLGFVRLLGIGHIYWLPMLVWLFMRFDLSNTDAGLPLWLWALLLMNSISLLIDTMDVLRYWAGDKQALDRVQ